MIKLILILSIFFILLSYLKFFRSALSDKLLAGFVFFCAFTAILFPDLTMYLANFLGVGRGADLVFYLYITWSVFIFMALYSKIMNLNNAITQLSRELALSKVREVN